MTRPIVVSEGSFASEDTYLVIQSNISFVNALFAEHLEAHEVSVEALQSYYVDMLLAQLRNGGFSQFVYNSRWNSAAVSHVRAGLGAIGAPRTRAAFEAGTDLVTKFGEAGLERFLSSDYFGDNPDRDLLEAATELFDVASEYEDLVQLNASWIRSRPDLRVLTIPEMESVIAEYVAAIPNLEERVAAARERAPRYAKLIDRLCEAHGLTLERITAGDPNWKHEGKRLVAWYFLSDRGLFSMVDLGDEALLFDEDEVEVARITV